MIKITLDKETFLNFFIYLIYICVIQIEFVNFRKKFFKIVWTF